MEGDDPKWREGLKTMFGPNMLKRTEVTKKTNLVFFIVESTQGLSQIDIRLRPLITEVRKIQKEIDDEEAEAKEKVCVQCRYYLASTIFPFLFLLKINNNSSLVLC